MYLIMVKISELCAFTLIQAIGAILVDIESHRFLNFKSVFDRNIWLGVKLNLLNVKLS